MVWDILECARAGAQGDASEVSRGKTGGPCNRRVAHAAHTCGKRRERRGTVLDAAGERRGPRRRAAFPPAFAGLRERQLTFLDLGGEIGFWEVKSETPGNRLWKRPTLPCPPLKNVIVITVDCLLCNCSACYMYVSRYMMPKRNATGRLPPDAKEARNGAGARPSSAGGSRTFLTDNAERVAAFSRTWEHDDGIIAALPKSGVHDGCIEHGRRSAHVLQKDSMAAVSSNEHPRSHRARCMCARGSRVPG